MLKSSIPFGPKPRLVLLAATMAGLAISESAKASVVAASNVFPPVGGAYETAKGASVTYPGLNFTITHMDFTPTDAGVPLSDTADTEITFWPSSGDMDYLSGGGLTHSSVNVTGDLTVARGIGPPKLVAVKTISWNRVSGGPLIRNSPTIASTGEFDSTPMPDGTYQINSFLDLYTQVSLDQGATWTDASSPMRLSLTSVPEPTSVLLAAIPIALLRRRRSRHRSCPPGFESIGFS